MRGVVHQDVHALQRVCDVTMDWHTVRLGAPACAQIVAGGRTTHGGAQRQVFRRQDAFGHRPAGPTRRTRDAHGNRHDEHGTDVGADDSQAYSPQAYSAISQSRQLSAVACGSATGEKTW